MLDALLVPVQRALAGMARRAVLLAVGGLLVAIGAGFITAALWTLLAYNYGSIAASGILGLLFLGTGLIIVALPVRHKTARRAEPAKAKQSDLMQAFLGGIEAGKVMGRR